MILEEKKGEVKTNKGYEPNLSFGGEPATDFGKLYAETVKSFTEGEIVKGIVVAISGKEALVDIGYKSEGIISLEEFSNPAQLQLNQEIEVYVDAKEDDEGRIILSRFSA